MMHVCLKRRPKAARGLVLLTAFYFASACASYTQETSEIRSLYKSEGYRDALKKLDESSFKADDKNKLLYRLEKAMILDRLGERDKSRRLLIEADKIADDLYTTSVSRQVVSLVVSDAQTDYAGEDYEKVAIHTQLALSFLADKKLDEARVEARKINSKLQEINKDYDVNKNKYGEDAFARYLAGMIYETRGEWDSAIIDYGRAIELYSGSFSKFSRSKVPDHLIKAQWRLLKKRDRGDKLSKLETDFPKITDEAKKELLAVPAAGELIVIHEVGHIATKVAGEFFFSFGKQLIRFSYPTIRKAETRFFTNTGISIEPGGKDVRAVNAADMDEIARQTLEDKRLRLVAKQSARLIAKGQLTEQAYKNFGPIGGLAANVFSFVTETADTRSWTLLPEAYYVTRVRLKPGKYDVKIKTNGRVSDILPIEIKAGAIQLQRDAG